MCTTELGTGFFYRMFWGLMGTGDATDMMHLSDLCCTHSYLHPPITAAESKAGFQTPQGLSVSYMTELRDITDRGVLYQLRMAFQGVLFCPLFPAWLLLGYLEAYLCWQSYVFKKPTAQKPELSSPSAS